MKNKIPTAALLTALSWMIPAITLIAAGYLLFFRFEGLRTVIFAGVLSLTGLLMAALVRMIGDIGQMLFDFKAFVLNDMHNTVIDQVHQTREEVTHNINNLSSQVMMTNRDLQTKLELINKELQSLGVTLKDHTASISTNSEQINCDTKDINQNIRQLRTFFEQIEKHLRLEK